MLNPVIFAILQKIKIKMNKSIKNLKYTLINIVGERKNYFILKVIKDKENIAVWGLIHS